MILEENKSSLIEFGRYAQERYGKKGRKLGTFLFLKFTHYEKENQQEEVCKEIQGGFLLNTANEKSSHKRDNKEIEPDVCWVLLLRSSR